MLETAKTKQFWQAPGNGRGFDARLDEGGKMNRRSITVMQYIASENGKYIKENEFVDKIADIIEMVDGDSKNESLKTHFYKPLMFLGFVRRDKFKNLQLSIEGYKFIEAYQNQNYNKAMHCFVSQLDECTFEGGATPNGKNINIWPFRVLFKLLMENRNLSKKFINHQLVHIREYEDLDRYLITGDLNDISFHEDILTSHQKFFTWQIKGLVALGILKYIGEKISFDTNNTYYQWIENLYKNQTLEMMFWDGRSKSMVDELVQKKRRKRDGMLIKKVKKDSNYQCALDCENDKWKGKDGNPYMDAHHVIPHAKEELFNVDLDVVENMVCLCPSCHMKVHHGSDNDKAKDQLWDKVSEWAISHNINKEEYLACY
jgi:5-methylcytosine-specific restriction protein A